MKLSQEHRAIIERIKQFIDDHPNERIETSSLVAMSGVSESTLTKGFKIIHGTTIYRYQLHVNMKYAKERINKGDLVKTVALELGYSSSSSFARAFYSVHHHPPKS